GVHRRTHREELKQVDHSTVVAEKIMSQVPPAVHEFLGSSLGDSVQKVLRKYSEELNKKSSKKSHKSASEIIKIKKEHASKQKWPKHSATPFDKTAENEYKDILFKMMMASKSYEKHPAH
nr:hypothetical protein [Tanacetum cinerariifolium]GFB42619.1 hypothetical protein [Tanacetum cinerariifolium]